MEVREPLPPCGFHHQTWWQMSTGWVTLPASSDWNSFFLNLSNCIFIHSERIFFSGNNKLTSIGKSGDGESSEPLFLPQLAIHNWPIGVGDPSLRISSVFPIHSDSNSVTSKKQAPTTGMTIKCVTSSGEEGGGWGSRACSYRLGAVRGTEEKINHACLPSHGAQKLRYSLASGF